VNAIKNMRVVQVDLSCVHITWPKISSYIADALTMGGVGEPLYELPHIQSYVTSGEWMLLVAIDDQNKIHGAMTLVFQNYPLHRVAFITAVGGEFIITKEMYDQLTEILKFNGATMIHAYGRPSIVRLLRRHNMKNSSTLVEATL